MNRVEPLERREDVQIRAALKEKKSASEEARGSSLAKHFLDAGDMDPFRDACARGVALYHLLSDLKGKRADGAAFAAVETRGARGGTAAQLACHPMPLTVHPIEGGLVGGKDNLGNWERGWLDGDHRGRRQGSRGECLLTCKAAVGAAAVVHGHAGRVGEDRERAPG